MMNNTIPIGAAIVFSTKDDIDFLMDLLPGCQHSEREMLIDVVTANYVAAFCILFPYSRVQYNRIDLVSLRLAQMLCSVGCSRLIDGINHRAAIHHSQDDTIRVVHEAVDLVFEHASDRLRSIFDPCNREVFSSGVDGEYDIRINDCANGHLIKAKFNVKNFIPVQPRQTYTREFGFIY